MDEPTVGIDPQSRRMILDTIKELNQEGMTILYTTHHMEEAQELSNRWHYGLWQADCDRTQDELTQETNEIDLIQVQLDPSDNKPFIISQLETMNEIEQVKIEENGSSLFTKDAESSLA